MSVKITGVDEILKNLENKLGKSRTTRVVNKAMRTSGDLVVDVVKSGVAHYADTGATVAEVVRGNIKGGAGKKTLDVGWRGDKSRWRLVHLNEFGYTRWGVRYSPRGLGSIQKAYESSKKVYWNSMKSELGDLAK